MAKKPSGGGGGGGHDGGGSMRWLLTYADLITLLLAFFIVMYAMSKVDEGKYKALAKALSQVFTSSGSSSAVIPLGEGGLGEASADAPPALTTGDELSDISESLRAYLAEQGLAKQVFVTSSSQGLVVSFTGSVLFDRGRADLREEALPVLSKVAEYLQRVPNSIGVAGSTDNLPINTMLFPTNWELSVVRSTSVIRFLTEKTGLNPRRFVALGYGEYHPLFPNTSEDNRQRNRRVDIIVYKHAPFAQRPLEGK